MKKLSLFAFVMVLALVMPLGVVHAAEVQAGKTVFIGETEAITDNAYLAGGQVSVSAPAAKDLLAAGGRIIVNAPVSGDLMLAGGNIDVLSTVAGDVRIAGGNVTIAEAVGGDVIVFGGDVTLLPGATVSGDVIVFAGSVDVQGAIAGKLDVRGETVTINAAVAGPVSIHATRAVSFGANTALANALTYRAPSEATIENGASLGEQVVFTKQEMPAHDKSMVKGILAILGVLMFVKFIGMLTTALVATYVFKNASLALCAEVMQKFWQTVGIGFIAITVTPIAIVLLFISVIGMYLGFILGILYLLALLVAGIYMCIIAGAFLSRWIKKETQLNWIWTLAGTVLVFLLSFVPIIGWVAMVLLFFASMGAVVMSMNHDAKAKMDI